MNICCERYFKLLQDEYLEIKKFIDNNIYIIESAFAPMVDYIQNVIVIIIARVIVIIIRKKLKIFFLVMNIMNFMKKIIKSYFNIWYIKFFYLLQKDIKLNKNIRNINVLIDKFINVYDNSNIACNKKK